MDIESYFQQQAAAVGALAHTEGEFVATAFTRHCGEILTEAGEFDDIEALDFEGAGTNQRKLKVNGYDLENADNSIAVVASVHYGTETIQTLSATDAKAALRALHYFLLDALDGSFMQGREQSSPAYQLASDLRSRGRNVSRYRLYLMTDARLSDRLRSLPSEDIHGIPVDFHLWDIERFHQLHQSQSGHEPLQIDLTEWANQGLPALRVESTPEFATYLASVPGRVLSSLYSKHGSRLLESNVRSYLSNRGKINKGIRATIHSAPQNFMAFNNGVTATATSVTTSEDGSSILSIEDLQIVNGGQTTASLFFVQREAKSETVLDGVFVQMKLVVVAPALAAELIPNISRFANSQNAVSSADFFSNSPYHVRLAELSRKVLVPSRSGAVHSTHWYYERTRGQYENERNKLSRAEAVRFENLNPKSQKFDKPALAKYVMSWDQRPHTVSAGAQKNFVAFADIVAKSWDKDPDQFNEQYFKETVAKGILFAEVRNVIKNAEWYRKAYLANIAAYTVAKIASLVERQGQGKVFDFDAVWSAQAVPDSVLVVANQVGRLIQEVLTSEHRSTTNVTEWAKKAQCWDTVKAMPYTLPADFLSALVDAATAAARGKAAKANQKVDNGIGLQSRLYEIPTDHWKALEGFAGMNRVASPTDMSILGLMTGRKSGVPSERQAARLIQLVANANERGFTLFSPW